VAAGFRYISLRIFPAVVRLCANGAFVTTMANQVAQNTWSSKYRSKNDRDPPDIYENLNVSLLGARPGEADPGHTYPRLPQEQDFPKYIENRIVASNAPKKDIQYVIVVLHGYAADIPALLEFSKKHLLGPRTACVLVRGTNTFQESDGTYCWSDNCDFIGGPGGKIRALQAKHRWLIKRRTGFSSIESFGIGGPSRSNTNDIRVKNPEDSIDDPERNDPLDDEDKEEDVSRPTFVSSTKQIGLEVITDVLVRKCGFKPRDIAIVGHDQGGSAALAVAAACWKTKFGGVVTIGGALPSDFPDLVDGVKSLTHVLLLGGKLGDIDNKEAARIGRVFAGTTLALKQDKSDDFDDIDEAALVGFLAHQLRREEWTKEAVITFGESSNRILNPPLSILISGRRWRDPGIWKFAHAEGAHDKDRQIRKGTGYRYRSKW
jgi:predicted esterase